MRYIDVVFDSTQPATMDGYPVERWWVDAGVNGYGPYPDEAAALAQARELAIQQGAVIRHLIKVSRQSIDPFTGAQRVVDYDPRIPRTTRATREWIAAFDPESPGYFSTEEVARMLGVSPGRVRQYVAEGRLPVTKFGNTNLIRPGDLAAFERNPPGRPRQAS